MAGLGHTRYFTESTPDKLITDAAAQSEAMWPAVERVIRAHATLKDAMVIDWWLLDPRSVAALALDNVLSVWLCIDAAALLRREAANLEFLQGSAYPELMLSNFMERSLWRNELVRAEADALGLPVIHQPGGRPVTDLVDEVLLRTGLTKRLPRPEYSD